MKTTLLAIVAALAMTMGANYASADMGKHNGWDKHHHKHCVWKHGHKRCW
jgi:hypothetical protein